MYSYKANKRLLRDGIEKWFEDGETGERLYKISTKSKFRISENLIVQFRLSDTHGRELMRAKKSDYAFNIFCNSTGDQLARINYAKPGYITINTLSNGSYYVSDIKSGLFLSRSDKFTIFHQNGRPVIIKRGSHVFVDMNENQLLALMIYTIADFWLFVTEWTIGITTLRSKGFDTPVANDGPSIDTGYSAMGNFCDMSCCGNNNNGGCGTCCDGGGFGGGCC
ncbi:unnamed protein product [Rotaria sp. Silwood1]|nr:unnamed protein product [Rotaria sp. Silwood1]CAF1628730.1 unnamed protein product [Rotaria sp. Silwood1]CAF3828379.1 unnamed protein product [Rotaria sp. Silwood1]CAF3878125.1 unnamed protein product [Rotaria sp. Silwood1]CAF4859046.1 unnamed protein product [Rotaria sp. Silwood1]